MRARVVSREASVFPLRQRRSSCLVARWAGVTADRPADIGVSTGARWQLSVERVGEDAALVHLAGSWKLEDRLPDPAGMAQQLPPGRPIHRLAFDAQGITVWDTGLLAYVSKLCEWAAGKSIETDLAGLPDGIRRLLQARGGRAVVGRPGRRPSRLSWLARVGTDHHRDVGRWSVASVTFVGRCSPLALAAFLRERPAFRRSDLVRVQLIAARRPFPSSGWYIFWSA